MTLPVQRKEISNLKWPARSSVSICMIWGCERLSIFQFEGEIMKKTWKSSGQGDSECRAVLLNNQGCQIQAVGHDFSDEPSHCRYGSISAPLNTPIVQMHGT